jgi:hypothetical protein
VTELILDALDVAGDRAAWEAAGFAVDDDGRMRVGQVAFVTGAGSRGIGEWHLAPTAESSTIAHPNGATVLDHLVVFTDDSERTTNSYAEFGWEPRRMRDVGNGTTQTFFRTGEVIIELVGPIPNVRGERFWGLAFSVADLDACAVLLGENLGRVKDAVQTGRRIATLRHEACGLTVPIAFMSEELG